MTEEESVSNTENRSTVRPLSADEGGGWLAEDPDLPDCMSDGKTSRKPSPTPRTRNAAGSRP
jgi:hypothetical protein